MLLTHDFDNFKLELIEFKRLHDRSSILGTLDQFGNKNQTKCIVSFL